MKERPSHARVLRRGGGKRAMAGRSKSRVAWVRAGGRETIETTGATRHSHGEDGKKGGGRCRTVHDVDAQVTFFLSKVFSLTNVFPWYFPKIIVFDAIEPIFSKKKLIAYLRLLTPKITHIKTT